ncbi:MlaD family protein [Nocardia crassostreae]|uniref:MlaD family protein n=1 Tax=Nocardia crassostreae TaxID=53428 RepID=UPI000831F4B1|nr:MlaD family protein [Nocardia crassostreae]
MKRHKRIGHGLGAGALAAVALAGCGVDRAQLTLPGSGVPGPTYTVHVELANALNLPSRARVKANGADVGKLRRVTVVDPVVAKPGSVIADIEVQRSVTLPSTATVQLRQDTILGDIYIALDIPPGSTAAPLGDGGTIPRNQTTPPLQIEDMLSGMATLASGGVVQQAQHIIDRVNAALPADPAETARIVGMLKADIIDLGTHLDDVDAMLNTADANAKLVMDNKKAFEELLTAQGAEELTQIAQSFIKVTGILGSIGGIAHAIEWLVPLIRQGDAAASAFVPMVLAPGRALNLSMPSNLARLVSFLRDKLIPFANRPRVDILAVRTEPADATVPMSADDRVDNIVAALRMIGMVR